VSNMIREGGACTHIIGVRDDWAVASYVKMIGHYREGRAFYRRIHKRLVCTQRWLTQELSVKTASMSTNAERQSGVGATGDYMIKPYENRNDVIRKQEKANTDGTR